MITLNDGLLIWIACFVFFAWYERSPFVLKMKIKYGKYKFKIIKYIKKAV